MYVVCICVLVVFYSPGSLPPGIAVAVETMRALRAAAAALARARLARSHACLARRARVARATRAPVADSRQRARAEHARFQLAGGQGAEQT